MLAESQNQEPGTSGGPAVLRRSVWRGDAGVSADGSGSHRIVINGDAGSFADPDRFSWESPQHDATGAAQ
jgi:hypothetical protein